MEKHTTNNSTIFTGGMKILLKGFFEFVEIRTKFASIIPFALGTVYSIYHFKSFNFINFVIMFISLIAFDMATTAINNYCDYKKMLKSNKNNTSTILLGYLNPSIAYAIILLLLIIAVFFGIILTVETNVVVLLIGIFSFIAGILYSFGPIPISRMPLGELFSGTFMGFIIIFLSVYIHVFDKNIVSIILSSKILTFNMNFSEVINIFVFSIPAMTGIANIMLANNICDVESDILYKRYTLPHYIGKQNALKLFAVLYYLGYIDILVLTLLRIIPVVSLLIFFTIFYVNSNIKTFSKNPIKSKNFVLSVKNFVVINLPQVILIGIMILIK
jgi:1,4-dihydroxy-2-naphthoate polyprenyltransferase